MYVTNHAKMRFYERVKYDGMPKKRKEQTKFINNYVKKAFKLGLTPKEISNQYLKDYMLNKLQKIIHRTYVTKITYYKNNLFLFHVDSCITILNIPENAKNIVDNNIFTNNLSSFINRIKEKNNVKNWLRLYSNSIFNTSELKKCIIKYTDEFNYSFVINRFPLRAIKYIKNDSNLKKIIIKSNKHRNKNVKDNYNLIWALLLLLPKNQILKLQLVLKNNKNSIFRRFYNKSITRKQLDLCYKQLYIMLNGNLIPKYNKFKVRDNKCYDIINDCLLNYIDEYSLKAKELFK